MSAIVVLILRILLTLCLYGFLIWAIFTIWRDLREQGQLLSAPVIPNLTLAVLETEETQRLSFDTGEIGIGRSQASDYPIIDDTVSARHARLRYHHNQWWIEDLKSTNGTFLNDERVIVPTVVVSGDELRCGQVNLLISIAEKNR
ncbi:MAG: FHA domain-containing protein [Anaerolineaceae bacterium]|nr:FHA domain-containing protein [Anaerolineaceae bacterium]